MTVTPNLSRRPQTFESDHAYIVPPHCKAGRRQEKTVMGGKVSETSTLAIFGLMDSVAANSVGFGVLSENIVIVKARKPIAASCQEYYPRA